MGLKRILEPSSRIYHQMCLSAVSPPMPPPQEGTLNQTQCGPLVPGTKNPNNASVSLSDLKFRGISSLSYIYYH